MGASLALGDGARSRRLLKQSQRERERQAKLELERRAAQQRNEERLRLARDLHDALGHQVALVSLQSAVAAEALPERVPEAQHAIAEIRNISLAAMSGYGVRCGGCARRTLYRNCRLASATCPGSPIKLTATAWTCGSTRPAMLGKCRTRWARRRTESFRKR
jgi:hypothetical protein